MNRSEDRAAEFLPLKTTWLHILLALAEGARHGYAIRTAVEERTGGKIRLWPATLYGALRDMTGDGLLEEQEAGPEGEEDARRRTYELTDLGRAVLRGEVRRLEGIVAAARAAEALGRA
jgi:DNA-binding PadR family transcriptional regulator